MFASFEMRVQRFIVSFYFFIFVKERKDGVTICLTYQNVILNSFYFYVYVDYVLRAMSPSIFHINLRIAVNKGK